jgi:hypothetical protein
MDTDATRAGYRAYTDAEITAKIADLKAALDAIELAQAYSIAGRSVTRADAGWIEERLGKFQVELESRSGTSPSRVSYVDHSEGL